MTEALQQFYRVFLQTSVSFGGTLVFAGLLWMIARIIDDLKLELIFKRVTPLSKLLVTLFLATIFLAPLNAIYSKVLTLLTSGNVALLARLGKTVEGVVLIVVLYKIYQLFGGSLNKG